MQTGIKVYLFALMYAGIRMTMTNESIAKQLSLAEEDVLKAWTYWESKGVINKHYPDPDDHFHYNVEFVNLKEQIYSRKDKNRKSEDVIPAHLLSLMSDNPIRRNQAY